MALLCSGEFSSSFHLEYQSGKVWLSFWVFRENRTTFVQEENMFWTRVPSAVLRVVRASSRQSDSNTTTTTTSTTTTTTTTTTMAPTVHAEVPASASHVSVVAVYCAVVLGLMLMFVF